MKKVLMIAYFFPPLAASGSLRPLGFCRYLEQYGWKPWILTVDPTSVYPPMSMDESLLMQAPPSLQIDRVSHKNPVVSLINLRNRIRKISTFHSLNATPIGIQEGAASSQIRFPWIARMKGKLFLRWFAFPDQQKFWLKPTIRKFSNLPLQERPDAVFATGSPWTALLIGRDLAKKFSVPFIADFRDPWTDNPYKVSLPSRLSKKEKRLERSVCRSASRIITTTPELREKLLLEHPDLAMKLVTITNGFDGGNLQGPEKKEPLQVEPKFLGSGHNGKSNEGALELCHFGSLYEPRNPQKLLQAIKDLYNEGRMQVGQLIVRFVGDWSLSDEPSENIARYLEEKGFLKRESAVDHDQCLRQMAQSDILLILQPKSHHQIPGKIFEYLAVGRPLLVIGGEGATSTFVEKHSLGRVCPNQVSALKEVLVGLLTGRERIIPPMRNDLVQFDYSFLARKLAEVLDSASQEFKS